MRRWLWIILALSMPLQGIAKKAERPGVLVCLGDSVTAGYGLSEAQAYPSLLEKRLSGWRVINAGVSGDTTAGGLKRLDWVLKSHPDAIFVALGGNDGLRGLQPAETERNLDSILKKARTAGSQVLLAGMFVPTNYGESYSQDFHSLYRRVAQKHKAPFMPFLLTGVAGKADLNQADGIHPTAEGQKILAVHIGTFLRSHLLKTASYKEGPNQAEKVIRRKGDMGP